MRGSPHIFVHVGLPKTASTFLQQSVFEGNPGIAYVGRPYTQANTAFNSLQYADDSLYDPAALEHELFDISNQANGRPVVVSDELLSGFPWFHYLNRGLIASRLAQVIPKAEVIVFLREQAALIQSLYNQYVKLGRFDVPLDDNFLAIPGQGMTYDEWLAGRRTWRLHTHRFANHTSLNIEQFRYSSLLALYARHFTKVHVFLYETLRDEPESVLDALSAVVGTKLEVRDGRGARNESLDDTALHRQLVLNRLTGVHARFDSRWGRRLSDLIARIIPNQIDAGRRHVRDAVQAADLHADNKLVNEAWNLGMERHASEYFG